MAHKLSEEDIALLEELYDPNDAKNGIGTDDSGTKICVDCKVNLSLDEFYGNRVNKDGKFPNCKKCVSKNAEEQRKTVKLKCAAANQTINQSGKKLCKDCNKILLRSEFYDNNKSKDGKFGNCKKCVSAKTKARHATAEGKANRKETVANYARNHPEVLKAKAERYKPIANARAKQRYDTDVEYRLGTNLRTRMRQALNGETKAETTFKLLGCTVEYFKQWLESQFTKGMTWKTHGTVWEIDHVRPCTSFKLENIEEQKECFNWKNLRPLGIHENRSKNMYRDHAAEAAQAKKVEQYLTTNPF